MTIILVILLYWNRKYVLISNRRCISLTITLLDCRLDGAVAKLSASGLAGTGFVSRCRLQLRAGYQGPVGRFKGQFIKRVNTNVKRPSRLSTRLSAQIASRTESRKPGGNSQCLCVRHLSFTSVNSSTNISKYITNFVGVFIFFIFLVVFAYSRYGCSTCFITCLLLLFLDF